MRACMSQQSMSRVHLPFAKVDNSTTHHKIANCPPPGMATEPPTYWSRCQGGAKFSGSAGATLVTISKWLAFSTFRGHRGHRKISGIALFWGRTSTVQRLHSQFNVQGLLQTQTLKCWTPTTSCYTDSKETSETKTVLLGLSQNRKRLWCHDYCNHSPSPTCHGLGVNSPPEVPALRRLLSNDWVDVFAQAAR